MAVAASATALVAGTLPGALASAASAAGDATVVVRGLAFPAGSATRLNLMGCDSVFASTAETPTPMIGVGPGTGPAGKRSLAFDPAGGNALGPVSYVDSLAATTVAGMWVYAAGGSQGVAYVGYQPPADSGSSLVWVGRAALSAPAGQWMSADATGLTYTWTRYDMTTRRVVAAPGGAAATVPAFTKTHGGDGAGFYTVGFGCDGAPFNTDAWRVGAPGATTTYDFDGYSTSTTISGPSAPVAPGDEVMLTGRLAAADGFDIAGTDVVLEARQPDGSWDTVKVVTVDGSGALSATVTPKRSTTYRWKMYNRPMVEGSTSDPVAVEVSADAGTPAPTDPPASGQAPAGGSAKAPGHVAPAPTSTGKAPAPQPVPQALQPAQEPTRASAPSDAPAASPSEEPSQTPAAPAATEPVAPPTTPAG